jgi:hypothetical protein
LQHLQNRILFIYWNCSTCRTGFSAPLAIFQRTYRFEICM